MHDRDRINPSKLNKLQVLSAKYRKAIIVASPEEEIKKKMRSLNDTYFRVLE